MSTNAATRKPKAPTIRAAIKRRGKHKSYICVFHSNKYGRRMYIAGLVAFMNIVIAEGNPDIVGLDYDQREVFATINGEVRKSIMDAEVTFRDGRREWWEFKRAVGAGKKREGYAVDQLQVQSQAAAEQGIKYRVITEDDLRGKELLFDNWFVLSGIIRRAHAYPAFREANVLMQRFAHHDACTIQSLLEEPDCDPALMFAAIAKGLAAGEIEADLMSELITGQTIIRRPS